MRQQLLPYRTQILSRCQRIVIKLGTGILVDANGQINPSQIKKFVNQISKIHDRGIQVVLVSSGAVAIGLHVLGIKQRPKKNEMIQAAAAVGQGYLIKIYQKMFKTKGKEVAQILLTHSDLKQRDRHVNSKYTLEELLKRNIIPIINENDTVSTEEICFGDNDYLSALVTQLVQADLLILLTNVDGLMAYGSQNSQQMELVDLVPKMTEEIYALVQNKKSFWGKGGMQTKLKACEMVTSVNHAAILANGTESQILTKIFDGKLKGTLFLPQDKKINSRKKWIAFFHHPKGQIVIDKGAVIALSKQGRSLLSSGIVSASGEFIENDVIRIVNTEGIEIARGVTHYSLNEIQQIIGKSSKDFEKILGKKHHEEVIHRNNLVVFMEE